MSAVVLAGCASVVLAFVATPASAAPRAPVAGGYDVSWPQCPADFPSGAQFAIVGTTDGRPYGTNPCLGAEYAWGTRSAVGGVPDLYMNMAEPGSRSIHWGRFGAPKPCSGKSGDSGCAYDYGWNAALNAFGGVSSAVSGANPAASRWWLDVETGNTWSSSTSLNRADIQGALDSLTHLGVRNVGVYSTGYQWQTITAGWKIGSVGGASKRPLDWLAGAGSSGQATSWCTSASGFSGGAVAMVQYPSGNWDGDVRC